MKYHPRDLRLL